MIKEFEKFNIGQVAVIIKNNKCLILEFADNLGKWGLPGGRIDKGELGEEAFKRELKEEINLDDFIVLGIVDYDIWINRMGNPFCGIANLIKANTNKMKLSFEHKQYKWISESELDNYNFIWPNAKRMIINGFKYNKLLK
jgi:8-oxo-dGTP diphosphatase